MAKILMKLFGHNYGGLLGSLSIEYSHAVDKHFVIMHGSKFLSMPHAAVGRKVLHPFSTLINNKPWAYYGLINSAGATWMFTQHILFLFIQQIMWFARCKQVRRKGQFQ